MSKKGILLVNLGTPDSASTSDVRKYLREFLLDPRVLDISTLGRWLLVNAIIVPFRGPKSAATYRKIWSDKGSPLMVWGNVIQKKVQALMGDQFQVELAMRYQSPSIEEKLNLFRKNNIKEIVVFPMFPQYASATTGSVHQKVMEIVKDWQTIPDIHFIQSYPTQPTMIQAFAEKAKKHNPESYDHILFSYHGLPVRQLIKADESKQCCGNMPNCCKQISEVNQSCYGAQCFQTTYAIADALQIPKDKFSVSFQSRLGRAEWAKPYTINAIEDLAKAGKKKVLVLCPGFICDCLETTFEIGEEYSEEFVHFGGEKLQLVEGLNDSDTWAQAICEIIKMV
jgi:protoporphyrin/coproporphyrin ferrochelatase